MSSTAWHGIVLVSAGGILLALFGVRACRASSQTDWGAGWKNLIDGLVRLFCRRYHRFEFEPVPLPERGPAILVCNHVSGLDPLLLIAACRRPLRFMIAVEQYRRFGLTWLFRAAGCIPVDRGGNPHRAYRAALKALAEGEVVALFPHGKIHLDSGPPRRLKGGAAKLAHMTGALIYPVRVEGIRGEGHIVRAVVKRSRARLRSFAPVDCSGLSFNDCLVCLATYLDKPHVEAEAD